MRYITVPVFVTVRAETEDEAYRKAYAFMPWIDRKGWSIEGHKHLNLIEDVDNWNFGNEGEDSLWEAHYHYFPLDRATNERID